MMAPLTQLAEHSLYIEYSITLENTLTEEADVKQRIQSKDSFSSKKRSRTMKKIQTLSWTLRTLLFMPKVDTNNNDANINDFDEPRDSIHLSKQRIQSRHLGPGIDSKCGSKESESYLLQKYLDSNVSTPIKNEFTKDKLSYASLLTGQSTFARNIHSLRAKAA